MWGDRRLCTSPCGDFGERPLTTRWLHLNQDLEPSEGLAGGRAFQAVRRLQKSSCRKGKEGEEILEKCKTGFQEKEAFYSSDEVSRVRAGLGLGKAVAREGVVFGCKEFSGSQEWSPPGPPAVESKFSLETQLLAWPWPRIPLSEGNDPIPF